jgi:ATP-dependent Lhr-like helicase
VAGFAGEQFAKPDAVDALRVGRHLDQNGPALRIAAADPLNLAGILTPGPRVSPLSAQDVALLPAGSGQDLTPRNAA